MHWWEQPVRGTLVCQHHMRNSKLEKICFQQKSRWSFFVLVLNENFKTQSIFKPWNSICSKKSQTSECLHPNTSLLLLLKQHNKDMLDLQPSQCITLLLFTYHFWNTQWDAAYAISKLNTGSWEQESGALRSALNQSLNPSMIFGPVGQFVRPSVSPFCNTEFMTLPPARELLHSLTVP